MREAVRLADQARIQFMEQRQQETSRTGLVRPLLGLSLGPYGATLSPAQEFDGLYPPPYGPCGFNNPNNMKTKSTSFFNSPPPYLSTTSETSIALEEKAESELCSFHLGRLLVFAEDEATWSRIDCVMFETVPLLREGRAIRRAVGMLQGTMRLRVKGWRMKPWWVSFVYPEGKCPEEVWTGGPRICMAKIVNEMMKDSLVGANSEFARPSALGINCTQPEFISSLVNEMTDALGSLPADDAAARPWLTLYPNGGLVYDITTQRWIRHPEKGVDSEQKYWAESVLSAARRSMPANGATVSPWSGIILGGCCKTGPAHITELGRICYSTRV
ncbi:AdoMet-homocysteine methyltransferase [Tulasnella sp. 419]|nr:AdoMet-homocysteine methyltransferase [Tulasnella sp. 419]